MSRCFTPRTLAALSVLIALGSVVTGAAAQERATVEPVHRVANRATNDDVTTDAQRVAAAPRTTATAHALDHALEIAYNGLENLRSNVRDYTAVMIKRERINGRMQEPEYMEVKIRNRRQTPQGVQPFSIYMKFLRPANVRGREVIWVEGRNNNNLVAHEGGGFIGLVRVNLDPDSRLAMQNNRYPIYEAGIENLVVKLIEKAERDRKAGDCDVKYMRNATINGRTCTVIRVTHPHKRAPYDYHVAEVFIDDELQIPIRYAAYSWPETPGGPPVLEEEYTYINVRLNVGLTDQDFNPDNPAYSFP